MSVRTVWVVEFRWRRIGRIAWGRWQSHYDLFSTKWAAEMARQGAVRREGWQIQTRLVPYDRRRKR